MRVFNDRLPDVRGNIEGVQWPPVTTGAVATFAAMLHFFEESQWLPYEVIAQRQYKQLSVLVAHAYAHSQDFRARMDKAGHGVQAITSLEGLMCLPVLSRSDIQRAGNALHCTNVPKTHLPLTEGKSSGSTGEPVTVKKTAVNGLLWQAIMMREHFWHKRDFNGRLMVIRSGIKDTMQQASWGLPADLLFTTATTMGVSVLHDIKEHIRALQQFKPEHLNIYPSTLDGLVKQCQKDNIRIEGLKHIWCISETLTPEVRKRASEFFNASVEDDYSSNELGIIALQCPDSGLYHVMSESVIVEILDENNKPCKEGEIGKVLVTSLNNFATPLIRYEIGDYAQAGGTCSCGRGLPVIQSVKGRKRNLVVKPDGTRHWPTLTVAMFRCGLPIHQFQVVQHSMEDVEVRLSADAPFSAEEEAKLSGLLHDAMGHAFPLRYTYFTGRLPLAANGKFEDFICKL